MTYLTRYRKSIVLLTALALVMGLLAGCSGPTATAAVMKLRRTEGTVSVSDDAGKSLEAEQNLGLYSGYTVKTRSESYAWIDLDEVKLTKLDERSSVEITKDGGELGLSLKSGSLFFNITEPLGEEESLNIRTSSMVIGIRGTCGWVTEDSVALLEGKVTVQAGEQSAAIAAGEMAVMTGDGALEVVPLLDGDVPAYIRDEIGASGLPNVGGTAGDIFWSIQDGVLTISGTGDMEDYTYTSPAPWHRETFHSVIIKPGVNSIGIYAFYNCRDMTSIDIPDSVTSIRDRAFDDCRGLTDVTIPGSVISIGDSAFTRCGGLTDVTILDGVTSIGKNAFGTCGSLTHVALPDSVTSLGENAFTGCSSLTGVEIPNGVTTIKKETFYGCVNMTSVSIPDSVTSIETSAFRYCPGLTSVTIPSSVTSIGDLAFASCYSLTSVTIPEGVTSIGSSAFGTCGSLTDVYFTGTANQFSAIAIGDGNEPLRNATVHYIP